MSHHKRKAGGELERKRREPRAKIACRRCRKRRKKCTPLQNDGRKRCVACEKGRVAVCEYISIQKENSLNSASATPPDISSSQETSTMIPSDNLGPALLTWQLELDTQFSQPMASSSTPISYDPFPGNTSPRSRFIGHATPRQDDYDRPPYSNSQSLPPADNHSLYLNPGGQHMGNYPSTTGHGTPSTTPDLYQVPSQYFILSNDIPPPFDESFRHRGQGIPFMHYRRPCELCSRRIPHLLCHDIPPQSHY